MPPATSKPAFICNESVYDNFDFRVLRENRRITVDETRAAESEGEADTSALCRSAPPTPPTRRRRGLSLGLRSAQTTQPRRGGARPCPLDPGVSLAAPPAPPCPPSRAPRPCCGLCRRCRRPRVHTSGAAVVPTLISQPTGGARARRLAVCSCELPLDVHGQSV